MRVAGVRRRGEGGAAGFSLLEVLLVIIMHTVSARSVGNYLYERETTGPQPRPYHLTVFLQEQAEFVVP